ncbi:MAG: T9SS type A sorting domain-containing protein [Bacteroidetes bacterium]|nr:T9SS type A sorting domain-containing protein [Bacteroidota bacterium]
MKFILIASFVLFTSYILAQTVTPSEYLTIAFEDSTGAKDTVIVGHYDDSCYLSACQAIVSPGVDSAFGEVNLSPTPPSSFTARVESKISDGSPYDTYMKKDIRYNDFRCLYTSYNFKNDPLFYSIRFYNATYPIIASISIYRDSINLPDTANKGCFSHYDIPSSRWTRLVYDTLGTVTYGSGWYDAIKKPGLIDTICCSDIDYYKIYFLYMWLGIEEVKKEAPKLTVFPNPTSNFLSVNFSSSPSSFEFVLYNMLGQLVKTGSVEYSSTAQIDVADVNPGLHLLQISTEHQTVHYHKLIIIR